MSQYSETTAFNTYPHPLSDSWNQLCFGIQNFSDFSKEIQCVYQRFDLI